MSFAAPILFWGLLSLLPLIAFYFLKVRPDRKPATAWFLWEKVFEERRARTLFQRFRDFFSLLLMAICFFAIVAAAARPFWTGDSRRDLMLIIDNSASMNATDGEETRLEQAKRVASDIVRSLSGHQRCSIASLGNEIVMHSGLTDNPKELLDAVARIEPTSLPSSLREIEKWDRPPGLSTSASSQDEPRMILISDGCLGGTVASSVELLKVGSPGRGNIGFVACDMQRLPLPDKPVGVFYQIASTFSGTVQVDLSAFHDTPDNLIRLVPLEIEPGLNTPEIFRIENAHDGKWWLQLEIKDSLADDNRVHAVLPPLIPMDVAVDGDLRFFYEHGVLAFSRGDHLLRLVSAAEAKLVIGQGNIATDRLAPDTDLLIFQPKGESVWWTDDGEEIAVTLPIVLDEEHPLLKHVEAASIPWMGARRLRAPAGSEILVTAEDGVPLLYRTVDRGRRIVVVNLDPVAADFFFSPWFPVLVYSAAAHLAGRTEAVPATYATGQIVPLPRKDKDETTEWTLPNGVAISQNATMSGPLSQTGFHGFKSEAGERLAGCSLLSIDETQIDNSEIVDTSQPISRGWSPVSILTWLAIAVLVIESMLFHRRWVG